MNLRAGLIEPWLPEDIDKMLALLDELEQPGFEVCTWYKPPDGLPYPEYSPTMERFRTMVFGTSAAIYPYQALPEDPPDLDPNDRSSQPPEFYRTATLNQIRRNLALIIRGERFCDGYIAMQFEKGTLLAALRRVRELAGGDTEGGKRTT